MTSDHDTDESDYMVPDENEKYFTDEEDAEQTIVKLSMNEIDTSKDQRKSLLDDYPKFAFVDHIKHLNRRYCRLQNAVGFIPNFTQIQLNNLYSHYVTLCNLSLDNITNNKNDNTNNYSTELRKLKKEELLGICLKNANSDVFGNGAYYPLITQIDKAPGVEDVKKDGIYVSWRGALSRLETLIYNEQSPLEDKFARVQLDRGLRDIFGNFEIVGYKTYDSNNKQFKFLKEDAYKDLIQSSFVHLCAPGTIAAKTKDGWISYGKSSSSTACPILQLTKQLLESPSDTEIIDVSFDTKTTATNRKKRKNTKQGGKTTKTRKKIKQSLATILEEGSQTIEKLKLIETPQKEQKPPTAQNETTQTKRRSPRKHSKSSTPKITNKRDKNEKFEDQLQQISKKNRPYDKITRFPRDLSHTKQYKNYTFKGQGSQTKNKQVCVYKSIFVFLFIYFCARIV